MSYLTLEQIPASLRSTPQWVAWRYITRDGKQTKAPVSPHDGSLADSTSGKTWGTFEQALAACKRDSSFAGVGFVFTADDPYCGVDLDNSIDADGNIKPWALDLLAKLDSYAEISPSRRGLKVFIKANKPGKPKHAATHKKLRAKDRPLANDFVSDEAFDQLLDDWFGNIARVLLPGRCFYIWGGYANCGNYPPVLKKHGLYFSQSIIWDKQHPVLTRKDFMGAHEWAFYGWKEGAGHKYYGPNNATDLWQVKKINPQSMSHLTQKPAELAVRAMQYSSVQGENVLDLFGGSGSTMIGAEQCGRNSFLMELDTLYCDVIADRFQRFTGIPAVLERTGESPIPMQPREQNMR